MAHLGRPKKYPGPEIWRPLFKGNQHPPGHICKDKKCISRVLKNDNMYFRQPFIRELCDDKHHPFSGPHLLWLKKYPYPAF